MTTYALIHGAHHGAWCWDFVVPMLEVRGHRTIAIDLPVDDASADLSRYCQVAMDALGDADDDLVIVGHSLGGLIAPVIATYRPIRRLVYLAAIVPAPGQSLAQQLRQHPEMVFESTRIDHGDGTWSRPAAEAIRTFYHDCSEARRRYALARLRRQSGAPHEERSPLRVLPDVPSTYVVCAGDRALRPNWQRQVARTALGVEPIEIPGSHSPFLARPVALVDVLTGIEQHE